MSSEILSSAAKHKMKTLFLSNETVQRIISDLSADVEDQLIQKVKHFLFAIQMDEANEV